MKTTVHLGAEIYEIVSEELVEDESHELYGSGIYFKLRNMNIPEVPMATLVLHLDDTSFSLFSHNSAVVLGTMYTRQLNTAIANFEKGPNNAARRLFMEDK